MKHKDEKLYRLDIANISRRTYLTNRMGSISHHITPLVINSLGGGHTGILSRTEAILRNQACAGRKNVKKANVY